MSGTAWRAAAPGAGGGHSPADTGVGDRQGDDAPSAGRQGEGTALGAITILNATATGMGCSLAIDARTTGRWTAGDGAWRWEGPTDDRLAAAVHAIIQRQGGASGATAACTAPFPPACGLKTSSSAATALLRAASAANDLHFDADTLDLLAVEAAVRARVTLTGAFDDQSAVSRGGCHLTDNRERRRLRSVPVQPWHVAVWVPMQPIEKRRVAAIDVAPARHGADEALALLEGGDVPGALTRNGEVFHALYEAAGLPVTRAPVKAALDHGALGAGLSGTGPAVAALFRSPVDLPAVPGGRWSWHEVVP